MKNLSFKYISFFLIILFFILIISIIAGARYQIYVIQDSNNRLNFVYGLKDKLINLELALEKSLMPMHDYIITGEKNDNEQIELENLVYREYKILNTSIENIPHEEQRMKFKTYNDTLNNLINKIILSEREVLDRKFSKNEMGKAMEKIDALIPEYENFIDNYEYEINKMVNNIEEWRKSRARNAIIFVLLLESIIIGIVLFSFIKFIFIMNKFIKEYTEYLNKIAKEKTFIARMKSMNIKEFRIIVDTLNNFVNQLHNAFITFNQHSNELAAFSEELSASSEEISSATEEVASSAELITEEISSVKDNTDEIKENVNDLQELMDQTEGYLNKSKSINEEFMKLMSNETNLIDDSSNKFDEMEESLKNVQLFIDDFSNQVNTIQESVDSIKSIHKKIELLSLNAAIEAARAGKEGGGFAVIAEEIRSLSSRSAEASGEIEKVMGDVISNIKQLHQLINQSMDGFLNIQEEWGVIANVTKKIQGESTVSYEESMKINEHIDKLRNRFLFVNDSFIQIVRKIENIVSTSEEISSSNEEISSQMEELAASSEELNSKAMTIKEFVDQYKL